MNARIACTNSFKILPGDYVDSRHTKNHKIKYLIRIAIFFCFCFFLIVMAFAQSCLKTPHGTSKDKANIMVMGLKASHRASSRIGISDNLILGLEMILQAHMERQEIVACVYRLKNTSFSSM